MNDFQVQALRQMSKMEKEVEDVLTNEMLPKLSESFSSYLNDLYKETQEYHERFKLLEMNFDIRTTSTDDINELIGIIEMTQKNLDIFLDIRKGKDEKDNDMTNSLYFKYVHLKLERIEHFIDFIIAQGNRNLANKFEFRLRRLKKSTVEIMKYTLREEIQGYFEIFQEISLALDNGKSRVIAKAVQAKEEIYQKNNYESSILEQIRAEKILNREKLINYVKNNGYKEARQTGSHKIFKNKDGNVAVVPYHNNDIGVGLSKKIQKQLMRALKE